ncbi:unnamed protein product [Oikopleura dioica]|uniref:Uncharacterized protein n=1 Tax=Oikopleura dioica TaxID=34765 RepID=E4YUU3_OIKDI|nr:unnamed protein product [Oikopleura dioica]
MDWIKTYKIIPSKLPKAMGLCGDLIESRRYTHNTLQFSEEIGKMATEYAEAFPQVFEAGKDVLDYIFNPPCSMDNRDQLEIQKTTTLKDWMNGNGIKLSTRPTIDRNSAEIDEILAGAGERNGSRSDINLNPRFFKLCSRVVYGKYLVPPTLGSAETLIFFKENELESAIEEIRKMSYLLHRLNESVLLRGSTLAALNSLCSIGKLCPNGIDLPKLQWEFVDSVSSTANQPTQYEINRAKELTTNFTKASMAHPAQKTGFHWAVQLAVLIKRPHDRVLLLDAILKARLGSGICDLMNTFLIYGLTKSCKSCSEACARRVSVKADETPLEQFEIFLHFLSTASEHVFQKCKGLIVKHTPVIKRSLFNLHDLTEVGVKCMSKLSLITVLNECPIVPPHLSCLLNKISPLTNKGQSGRVVELLDMMMTIAITFDSLKLLKHYANKALDLISHNKQDMASLATILNNVDSVRRYLVDSSNTVIPFHSNKSVHNLTLAIKLGRPGLATRTAADTLIKVQEAIKSQLIRLERQAYSYCQIVNSTALSCLNDGQCPIRTFSSINFLGYTSDGSFTISYFFLGRRSNEDQGEIDLNELARQHDLNKDIWNHALPGWIRKRRRSVDLDGRPEIIKSQVVEEASLLVSAKKQKQQTDSSFESLPELLSAINSEHPWPRKPKGKRACAFFNFCSMFFQN